MFEMHYIRESLHILQNSLCTQLFVQDRHIIIVLCLVEITSDWVAKLIFLSKLPDRESSAVVCRSVGKPRLITGDLAILLVDKEHVAMQSGVWWGS